MNIIKSIFLLCIVSFILFGCSYNNEESEKNDEPIVTNDFKSEENKIQNDGKEANEPENQAGERDGNQHVKSEIKSVDDLLHTEYFRNHALEHIFEGEVNRRGQAVGFHYEGLPSTKGKVIENSRTSVNEVGVYEAKVEISNVKKQSNQGKSSFFPKTSDAQQVVDEINEAYKLKVLINGNTYEGLSNNGLTIRMYLDEDGKIISAFPIY